MAIVGSRHVKLVAHRSSSIDEQMEQHGLPRHGSVRRRTSTTFSLVRSFASHHSWIVNADPCTALFSIIMESATVGGVRHSEL